MEHTIEVGDHLLAQKVTVNLGQGVKPGDIIVFENPDGSSGHDILVKRVIATAGQIVDVRDGAVYIDGKTWTARSEDGDVIARGSMVTIVRMEGVKLFVRKEREEP